MAGVLSGAVGLLLKLKHKSQEKGRERGIWSELRPGENL
jgi:hypothetical protein